MFSKSPASGILSRSSRRFLLYGWHLLSVVWMCVMISIEPVQSLPPLMRKNPGSFSFKNVQTPSRLSSPARFGPQPHRQPGAFQLSIIESISHALPDQSLQDEGEGAHDNRHHQRRHRTVSTPHLAAKPTQPSEPNVQRPQRQSVPPTAESSRIAAPSGHQRQPQSLESLTAREQSWRPVADKFVQNTTSAASNGSPESLSVLGSQPTQEQESAVKAAVCGEHEDAMLHSPASPESEVRCVFGHPVSPSIVFWGQRPTCTKHVMG